MARTIQQVAPWQVHVHTIDRTSFTVTRCPFDNGDPDLEEVEAPPQVGLSLPRYVVVCTSCGARGPYSDAPDLGRTAIRLWNERARHPL